MIRLFAALAVPGDIAEALSQRQHGLAGARWRPLEAFHVTLHFFGELPEDRADDLDVALSQVRGEAFKLKIEGVGAFGEGTDINAVWAEVRPNPTLDHLARRCETAARRAGLKSETRAYRPHLTLAYLRRPDPTAVAAWIQANCMLSAPTFPLKAFGLYSSWRAQSGSAYRLERRYTLASGMV